MRAHVKLLTPDRLRPQSEAKITVGYETKSDFPHHVTSVTLVPTWNPEKRMNFSTDQIIFPGTERRIVLDQVEIPVGIGGYQGFKFEFEVTEAWVEGADYTRLEVDPLRREVSEYAKLDALCYVNEDVPSESVKKFIKNWGFNFETISNSKEISMEMSQRDDLSCVFCVARSDEDIEALNQIISDAVGHGIFPIVLAESELEFEQYGDDFLLIECNLDNAWSIERSGGRAIHSFRIAEDFGFLDPIIDNILKSLDNGVEWTIEKSRDEIKNIPRYVLESIISHIFLKVSGGYETIDNLLEQASGLDVKNDSNPSSEQKLIGNSSDKNKTALPSNVVDLTDDPTDESQIVHVIPFDGDHRIWRWRQLYDRHPVVGSGGLIFDPGRIIGGLGFASAVEYGLLPRSSTQIEVKWYPDEEMAYFYSDGEVLYHSSRTNILKVNVKRQGCYTFKSTSHEGGHSIPGSWISFEFEDRIGGSLVKTTGEKSNPTIIKTGIPLTSEFEPQYTLSDPPSGFLAKYHKIVWPWR